MSRHRSVSALRIEGDGVSTEQASGSVTGEQLAQIIAQRENANVAKHGALAPSSERPEGREVAPIVAETAPGAAPPKRRSARRVLAGFGLIAALAGAGWYGHYWWTVGRFLVSTDDAYVGVHTATLASKVTGYVAAVEAGDNEEVRSGQVIARIDDGDYQLAVDAARDKIAAQEATIGRIGQQILAQAAAVDAAKAQLTSAKAVETRTASELKRQLRLNEHQFASEQALEQAQAARDQAVASVQAAQANVEGADTNVGVLKAQKEEAQRVLQQLKTALAQAERDLSFTVIRAPFDGVVGNRAIQVGDYVQSGQRLASLVPLADVYIDANFKETQLAGLRVGQPVSIAVDALPEHDIEGRVASLAPASGSVFSLLPPDNATGNFTKIVQRVPVRIHVPANLANEEVLRPGMSVVVSVNTKPGAHGHGETPVTTSSIESGAK
jgi:membrane fusion protein (multidrug efflux system)